MYNIFNKMAVLIQLIVLDWNNQLRQDFHYTVNKAFGAAIQLMLMTYILCLWSKIKTLYTPYFMEILL